MGISEKIANAKETTWLTEGLSEEEIKSTVELAKIAGQIERARLDRNMTQKDFAKFMGVSQGMVSKWESRDYNFSIKTLNEVCEKLDLNLEINVVRKNVVNEYAALLWSRHNGQENVVKNDWMKKIECAEYKEAIA